METNGGGEIYYKNRGEKKRTGKTLSSNTEERKKGKHTRQRKGRLEGGWLAGGNGNVEKGRDINTALGISPKSPVGGRGNVKPSN